ncbi:hypothetical protein K458DRAFT_388755 [Lentithecium fluviatile CBS 122367]|uniref:Uncharacterized protein n=1 Tax=Lentithecium fluviatile CBS 122367 TaxID=1168545 RepID=A0A6G1J2B5_9PLEO|nr:hypothetical protein K458DRAFT_388755 [Lentithecium fluviatile CBS 122367]
MRDENKGCGEDTTGMIVEDVSFTNSEPDEECDERSDPSNDCNIIDFLPAIDPREYISRNADIGNDINTVCTNCDSAMAMVEEERLVYEKALSVYKFTLAYHRKTVKFVNITTAQRELVEQYLLAFMRCHLVIILTADLLEALFLKGMRPKLLAITFHLLLSTNAKKFDPESTVAQIEEICIVRNHETFQEHCLRRLTLKSGKKPALSFTDRQLGWLHIVRDWDAYTSEHVKELLSSQELGVKRDAHIHLQSNSIFAEGLDM